MTRRVLLFREPALDWEEALTRVDIQPQWLPVLRFTSQSEEELAAKLSSTDHGGLILTSPRAATACIASDPPGLLNWKDRPIFVVGKATGNIVTERFDLKTYGADSGNADNLSDFIINNKHLYDNNKPLLFPCGNLKKDTLPTKLKQAEISLDCLTVYTTIIKETLQDEIEQLHDMPEILVFFSPSGVDAVIPSLKDLNRFKCVAIGPSTEKQIRKYNATLLGAASEPTVQGVICIITN